MQVVQCVQEEYIKKEIAKINAKQALLYIYVIFDSSQTLIDLCQNKNAQPVAQ